MRASTKTRFEILEAYNLFQIIFSSISMCGSSGVWGWWRAVCGGGGRDDGGVLARNGS